jgi:carbamoyl-phosphate synthase/aspartate carbamoyltransferase/dihydroorotase
MLPLLLAAVQQDRLTVAAIVARCVDGPRRVYGLPPQPETWVEIDPEPSYKFDDAKMRTRCGWTPFAGMRAFGRVERVVLRGEIVYDQGSILAQPGAGRVLFHSNVHAKL